MSNPIVTAVEFSARRLRWEKASAILAASSNKAYVTWCEAKKPIDAAYEEAMARAAAEYAAAMEVIE